MGAQSKKDKLLQLPGRGGLDFRPLLAALRGIAFAGPVEWDVASMIWNARLLDGDHAAADAAIAGYRETGAVLDERALDCCLTARAAVMSAWYPVLYPNPDASRRAKLQHRLDWLEQRRRGRGGFGT